ncbi:histidine kinase [Trinickia symbiotica]|uniref:Histidine kinase n=1 Tax=Trinickia symbiotica TaxID=863227 RepID=A0A2T3XQZ1_9BURK|nr:CBS domain-containing protein [Trinickia symbiotica]PTB18946.1 histidine kinase [Trinickia symbiotica]
MQAIDVMTPYIVSVKPDMTVRDAAALLLEHGISGAPVIDSEGHLAGMISDGDLLHRVEIDTEMPRRPWWSEILLSGRDAADYVKAHARLVRDVMTEHVITVDETTPLDQVANLLETHRIRRVPVMREDKVVGIVSRANLVQALAISPLEPSPEQAASDREIRAMLMGETAGRQWALPGHNVTVQNGVVHLWGYYVWSHDQVEAMRVAAEGIPGVRAVEDHTCALPPMIGA